MFNKKITKKQAVEIAQKKMPKAIAKCIIKNYKKYSKKGELTSIILIVPYIKEIKISNKDYFKISFIGEISWAQFYAGTKNYEEECDGGVDRELAVCIINCKNGNFKYIGICDLC